MIDILWTFRLNKVNYEMINRQKYILFTNIRKYDETRKYTC
jgi:hypothetical protein